MIGAGLIRFLMDLLVAIVLLTILIHQCCLADPMHIGKHSLSLKRPSFIRGSKSQRMQSTTSDLSAPSSSRESSTSLNRFGSSDLNRELVNIGANTRQQQLELECSKEAFDRESELAQSKVSTGELKAVDLHLAKHLKKCESMLASQLLDIITETGVTIEEEQTFDRFRDLLIESQDHTDFSSKSLDRHVPEVNLSEALVAYVNHLKRLTDPRSEKYDFNATLWSVFEGVCKPIIREHPRFNELLSQYDVLDKMSHLRDSSEEVGESLVKWMANIRICSYYPNNVDELVQTSRNLLLEKLGDEMIEDPEDDGFNLETILE